MGHRHKDSRKLWTTIDTEPEVPHPADVLTDAEITGLKALLAAGGGGGVPPVVNPPPVGDVTAPTLSDIVVTVTGTTTATVTWTTDEAATGRVLYGTTTAYGSATTSTSSGTSHSRNLTGLTPGQTYHLQVEATDTAGNVRLSFDRTFTTTAAPTLPGAPTGLVATGGNTQIVLNWTAPSSNGGSAITGYHLYRNGASLVTIGNVLTYTNTGLTNGLSYSYTVAAITAIGEGPQSNTASATPATSGDINPPNVSGVTISGLTTTGVTISCTTDEASTVVIEYGPTTAYGISTAATPSGTTHSRTITGLVPSTVYHFRIRATDTAGNLRLDSDRSFTTASVGGTIYGSAIETDSRDNRLIGGPRHDVLGFRFPTDGTSISFVAFDRRFGPPTPPGQGYSLGNGGTIKAAIQAEVSGVPSGVDLASTTFSPGNPAVPDAQFTRVALSATPPSGRAFLVLTNTHADPVNNYISANSPTVLEAHPDPRQPLGDDNAIFVKNDSHGWREYTNDTGDGVPPPSPYKNTPCFDITYADGHHAGIRYEGVRNANSFYGTIDGTDAIRETMTPTSTRSVSSAAFRVKRLSGSAPLTIDLLNSGGTVLATGTVPAASIPISPDLRSLDGSETFQQRENALAGGRWAAVTFGAVTLTAGSLYYLRASTTAGTVYMAVAVAYVSSLDTGGSTWGSYNFGDGHAQRHDSGSWSDLPTTVVDWQFWLR